MRSGGSLPQQPTLGTFCCTHSHLHTIATGTTSFACEQAVSYECVENLFIPQCGAPGSDMLLAWMGINQPERLGVIIQHKVLPGDTSLHPLLLSARCTMHFDCGGGGCRKLFPGRSIWQKATTVRLGWPGNTITKSSSYSSLPIFGIKVVSTPLNATISIEVRRTFECGSS